MSSDGFLGLGSNLGEPPARLERAARLLEASGVRILDRSSLCWTEPFDAPPQPWFLNQVLRVSFAGDPFELLAICQGIEQEGGRPPGSKPGRKGPRPIDIDILLLGDRIISSRDLTVPHPRLHLRRFVLVPMAQIAPDIRHPRLGATVRELLDRCPGEAAVLPFDGSPGAEATLDAKADVNTDDDFHVHLDVDADADVNTKVGTG